MTWAQIFREFGRRLARWLRQFDGAQSRRDLRELRIAIEEHERDPYEADGRKEVDALLDRANWPKGRGGDRGQS